MGAGDARDSPLADDAVAPSRSHAHHRHVGRFVAFRPVMFAARSHAASCSLQDATTATRAITRMRLGVWHLREAVCGRRGHDMVLHFEPERLSLQCLACGARTQGWTIDVNPVYRRPRRQSAARLSVASIGVLQIHPIGSARRNRVENSSAPRRHFARAVCLVTSGWGGDFRANAAE
jgi:hypothetical protein